MIEYNNKDNWVAQFSNIVHFIKKWHGFNKEASNINIGRLQTLNVPTPLLRFYEYYDKHLDELSGMNLFEKPDKIIKDADRITFYYECQGVYIWQTQTDEENPKVFVSLNEEPKEWYLLEERLCGFLYQALIFGAITSAPFQLHNFWISKIELDEILSNWQLAPFKPWLWPPYPFLFYFTDNALAYTQFNGDDQEGTYSFICAAKQKINLDFMKDFIDETWEEINQ